MSSGFISALLASIYNRGLSVSATLSFIRYLIQVFCAVIFLSIAMAVCNPTLADLSQPLNEQGVTELTINIVAQDVEEINAAQQSFTASIYYEVLWNDPRLIHPSGKTITRSIADIWHPVLQFVNQKDIKETFPKTAYISVEGNVVYRQRVRGEFTMPLNLAQFPFDHHSFKIDLAEVSGTPDSMKLLPGDLDVSSNLSITDWEISNWQFESGRYRVSPEKTGPPLVSIRFDASRNVGYYVLKVILPLSLIVMMSWAIFWIHPEQSGTQIAMSITCVLTLMTYRSMVDNLLPKLSYMTKMDVFVLGSTILLFVSLLQAVYTSMLVSKAQNHLAERIDIVCRGLFPLMFLMVILSFAL